LDFFQNQELARRNTRVLVLLYALAVAAVVAAVTAVLAGAWLYARAARSPVPPTLADVPPALWWGGALGTLAVIMLVTLVQSLRLGSSGEAVARMAGALPVPPETRDPLERRLLNVVEEMAIAAGVRVPKVYVMPGEPGINAFAAGTDVSNAVVAVTRGTLETLNRDELQGVIGHEFSHILHGDMRLNIRMIGVLAGIVFIGSLGYFILRGAGRGGSRRQGAAAVFAVGLGLFVVGYTGLFFARLIKAATARQREFLADAGSVELTKDPDAMISALRKIENRGELPGAESSIVKLFWADLSQALNELALEVLGPSAQLAHGSADAPADGRWQQRALWSRCASIAGGTNEIQRIVIARGLLARARANQ